MADEPTMTAAGLAEDSCLLANMSGMDVTTGLDANEVTAALAETAVDSATSELFDAVGLPIAEAVQQPPIHRVLQCRGASAMARGKHNVDSIVLHTPEGYVPGTLSVLSGTRAGFDFFLPPSGELYKCNDYTRFFSWHAGDLAYNRRAIGIEQWDFAANMPNAGDAHYQRLGRLCAYLVETLDLAVRHAKNYGEFGFIAHGTITPQSRWDPGKFDYDKLLDIVSDLVKGKPDPTKPEPEKPGDGLIRVYLDEDAKKGRQVFAGSADGAGRSIETLSGFGLKARKGKA